MHLTKLFELFMHLTEISRLLVKLSKFSIHITKSFGLSVKSSEFSTHLTKLFKPFIKSFEFSMHIIGLSKCIIDLSYTHCWSLNVTYLSYRVLILVFFVQFFILPCLSWRVFLLFILDSQVIFHVQITCIKSINIKVINLKHDFSLKFIYSEIISTHYFNRELKLKSPIAYDFIKWWLIKFHMTVSKIIHDFTIIKKSYILFFISSNKIFNSIYNLIHV